jgi:hypothetical protein
VLAASQRLLKYLWAAPCSLVGLLGAAALLALGARARCAEGALEVALKSLRTECRGWSRRCPFRAITFGHVILGVTAEELEAYRAHEQVHVRQYERWGLVFFIAYPLASLSAWWRGGDFYRDNRFEVEARDADASSGRWYTRT